MTERLKANYVDHISIAVKDLKKAEADFKGALVVWNRTAVTRIATRRYRSANSMIGRDGGGNHGGSGRYRGGGPVDPENGGG